MSLSVCVGMKPKKGAFLSHLESFQSILEKIASAISICLKEKRLDIISYITIGQDSMLVSLHPAEEEVHFYVESGYLVCSAKTSSAGPGYHAFVIELLEEVEKRCQFKWEWENEKMGFIDEGGYYPKRDFHQLQNKMSTYLQALSGHLISIDQEELHCLRLSLPLNLNVEHNYFAISPMGPWDKQFFESIMQDSSIVNSKAEEFFPWWDLGLDALFWKNVGIVKLWTEIKWQPPFSQNDATYDLLSSTLQCFENARVLSSHSIQMPEEEIKELKTLMTCEDYFIPKPDLMGFYRLNHRMPLTARWSILLPGYFYEAAEEDEHAVRYFHKDKSIRASSSTTPPDIIPNFPKDEDIVSDHLDVFYFEKDDCIGKATLTRAPESEGKYPILICHVAVPGSLCTAIIAVDDDKDIEWAVETFKSIKQLHAN